MIGEFTGNGIASGTVPGLRIVWKRSLTGNGIASGSPRACGERLIGEFTGNGIASGTVPGLRIARRRSLTGNGIASGSPRANGNRVIGEFTGNGIASGSPRACGERLIGEFTGNGIASGSPRACGDRVIGEFTGNGIASGTVPGLRIPRKRSFSAYAMDSGSARAAGNSWVPGGIMQVAAVVFSPHGEGELAMKVFLSVMTMLIPVTMIGIGALWRNHPPQSMNWVYGYRTAMSMKNKETWDFAHRYHSRVWLLAGLVLGLVSLVVLVAARLTCQTSGEFERCVMAVMLAQVLALLLSIIPTERALRKRFHADGTPRS